MFIPRLISGIAVFLGFVIICFVGGWLLWGASLLVGILCLFELYRCVGIEKKPVTVIGYIAVIIYYILIRNIQSDPAVIICMVLTLILMTIYTIAFPRIRFSPLALGIIGVFYLGVLSSGTFLASSIKATYAWLVLTSSWGTDTCAYFFGKKLGKKHPFPVLSPKKSVAGCIGGFVSSVIMAILLALIFNETIWQFALIAVIASAFSEIGDLAASAIKRQYGIKDYGTIIPGHGGVLDRFDSMLFAGCIVYIFAVIFH